MFHADEAAPGLFVPFSLPGEGGGLHVTGVPESNQLFTFTDSLTATNGSGPPAAGARAYQLRATTPP